MQLDEVALDALLPPAPAARPLDSDVALEIMFEDDELCDATATRHFERFSSPYERIELSEVAPLPRRARRTTFAKTVAFGKGTPSTGVPSISGRPTVKMPAIVSPADTVEMAAVVSASDTVEMPAFVPASATVPFERVWFDDEQPEKLASIEEPIVAPKASWWWLAISLVVGAAAVGWMASLA
jgi:hypothetical protein